MVLQCVLKPRIVRGRPSFRLCGCLTLGSCVAAGAAKSKFNHFQYFVALCKWLFGAIGHDPRSIGGGGAGDLNSKYGSPQVIASAIGTGSSWRTVGLGGVPVSIDSLQFACRRVRSVVARGMWCAAQSDTDRTPTQLNAGALHAFDWLYLPTCAGRRHAMGRVWFWANLLVHCLSGLWSERC